MNGQPLRPLRLGDHLCLIDRSAAERTLALVDFIQSGLAQGERCLFAGPAEEALRLEEALLEAGVDSGAERDRGALLYLTFREDWLPPGRLDPGALLDRLRQCEQQALDDGFSGLRGTWSLDWVLAERYDAGRWAGLERQLHQFLAGSRTTALCRYSTASAAPLDMALRTHPSVLLGGRVCPNACYEEPSRPGRDPLAGKLARIERAGQTEEELARLTGRLDRVQAALAQAGRSREDLLSTLAHELRNPLGTISNALHVLRLKGEGDEAWSRALEAAERQVRRQAGLIDSLLEASQVARGEVDLQPEDLDLAELVCDSVAGFRGALDAAGLTLDLQVAPQPLPVWGDRLRLSQALSNLLANAVKFTSAGGRVTVRADRSGDAAEIVVRDDGSGIEASELPYVFEAGTQGDHSLDRAAGGLGLGLAVVRGLIEMQGGEVAARSEGAGLGAEIRLRLPLQPGGPRGISARRILVVEDNPDAAATLRDFLELAGHQVALADSGSAGVEAAHRFHPEVVLCDIGLPGMSGLEVAAELRRDPATRSARLIALTGYGREEDRRKSQEAGFDLHLTKPVDPARLRDLLMAPAAVH